MPEISQIYEPVTLLWVAGDAVRFRILVQDPDPSSPDPENPDYIPRDLTGWTAAAQIRRKLNDETLLASFEINDLDDTGYIQCYLPKDQSELCRGISSAFWDLQLTDTLGDPLTITGGPARPQGDVTRV